MALRPIDCDPGQPAVDDDPHAVDGHRCLGDVGCLADVLGQVVEFQRRVWIPADVVADAFPFPPADGLLAAAFIEFPIEIFVFPLMVGVATTTEPYFRAVSQSIRSLLVGMYQVK